MVSAMGKDIRKEIGRNGVSEGREARDKWQVGETEIIRAKIVTTRQWLK